MMEESWLWKMEPVSPYGELSLDIEQNFIPANEDLFLDNAVTFDKPNLIYEPLTRAEVASKLLDQINNFNSIEEPFEDWLEENINLILIDNKANSAVSNENGQQQFKTSEVDDDYNKIQQVQYQLQQHQLQQQQLLQQQLLQQQQHIAIPNWQNAPELPISNHQDERVLVKEFDTLLNSYQPQSFQNMPTDANASAKNILEDINYLLLPEIQEEQQQQSPSYYTNEQASSPLQEHFSPLEQFNEVVENFSPSGTNNEEHAAVHQSQDNWGTNNTSLDVSFQEDKIKQEDDSDSSVSVKEESEESLQGSVYSNSSIEDGEEVNDDPDWSAARVKITKKCSRRSNGRIRKPYMRVSMDEKKSRKKEQNKNAATRYRQKKKQEVVEIKNEEQELDIKNKSLREEKEKLDHEVNYLKTMLRSAYQITGFKWLKQDLNKLL